jgi:hypothetical protein
MNNTSISKAVCLNFSDGTNTVYTKSAQINIPFEVEYIRVANNYIGFDDAGLDINAIITSNLVDNDVISTTRVDTSTKPLKHYYTTPRPINGSYDFSINLSNTLNNFATTSRVGYEVIGTLDTAVDAQQIQLNLGVGGTDTNPVNYVGNEIVDITNFKFIKTGAGLTLGTDLFQISDYDAATGLITMFQPGTINKVGVTWYIESNLLTIVTGSGVNINVGSFSNILVPDLVITSKISNSRFRIKYDDIIATVAMDFNTPNIYKYFNLSQCEVVLDLEFYKKVSIPRVIQNTQYYLWNSSSFNDIFNIDVLFPVDEIRVVNFNMISEPLTTIIGFSSDLVQSSILTSENYLSFSSLGTGNYQVNKKKYEYPIPRIINGAYKINANYMFTGLPYDLVGENGEFYFHFLFISYRKE